MNQTKTVTDVKKIAREINVPEDKWTGRCFEIATKIYKSGLVPKNSRVVYGLWLGIIKDNNVFSGRPFTHHGWIELDDGTIYDPTRFVFENKNPYVWIGINAGEYDVGGNNYREKYQAPRPKPKGTIFVITKVQAEIIKALIPVGEKRKIYLSDCFWLANLSLNTLGINAGAVYKVLISLGQGCLIPIDNRTILK